MDVVTQSLTRFNLFFTSVAIIADALVRSHGAVPNINDPSEGDVREATQPVMYYTWWGNRQRTREAKADARTPLEIRRDLQLRDILLPPTAMSLYRPLCTGAFWYGHGRLIGTRIAIRLLYLSTSVLAIVIFHQYGASKFMSYDDQQSSQIIHFLSGHPFSFPNFLGQDTVPSAALLLAAGVVGPLAMVSIHENNRDDEFQNIALMVSAVLGAIANYMTSISLVGGLFCIYPRALLWGLLSSDAFHLLSGLRCRQSRAGKNVPSMWDPLPDLLHDLPLKKTKAHQLAWEDVWSTDKISASFVRNKDAKAEDHGK